MQITHALMSNISTYMPSKQRRTNNARPRSSIPSPAPRSSTTTILERRHRRLTLVGNSLSAEAANIDAGRKAI